jgi:glutathione S-transferase
MAIRFYDLAGADEARRFSPYCWRTHMALKHKGLEFETIPWRFTEKDIIGFSGQGLVPVMMDGDQTVSDSWTIAEHLESRYPERPSLFGGPEGRHFARFTKHWAETQLAAPLFRILAKDIHDRLHTKDQEYFRTSREKRIGTTLEAFAAERDQAREQFRQLLLPMRRMVSEQPFLSGAAPALPDYIVFGLFQWARGTSPYALLADGDPVGAWRERMLDLHNGYARSFPVA